MFIRKKKNDSGKICVQVIDKGSGKYRVLHTVGSSNDPEEIRDFTKRAREWVNQQTGKLELDFSNEKRYVNQLLDGIEALRLVGLDLLLGRIFEEVGFGQLKDPYFKYLTLYRLAFPRSKLKTTEYLYRYHQINWDEDQVYRYLDKLHSEQKELVQLISYNHTLKVLGEEISIVFYDVTTLYFEIDHEDDLRKTGFSKDGRHQSPQIVLGLLVSKNGYPLAYEIFEGNKFEGHTMLPLLEAFKKKYNLAHLVVIADSGLLSKANISALQSGGYEFILGARIRNETQFIKDKLLALELENGESAVIRKGSLKLIITYSDSRAKKDRHNRERGLRRLEKQIRTNRLTKAHINNRGYNKYLKLEGEINITIDRKKFEQDGQWDGLKGYLTNAKLQKDQILENYRHLWKIEKAFRVAKSELKIRPVYHRLQRRIEAHICLSFVAYKVYKELERQLLEKKAGMSPERAIEIARSIFQIEVKTPDTNTLIRRTLLLNDEQKRLADIFKF